MKKPYEILAEVHDAYRGLAVKLSRITGKSEQWYRSHSYEPGIGGNKSQTDGFFAECELFEAAMPGAGRMLSDRSHAELNLRFTENDLQPCSQKDLTGGILKEAYDVLHCLNEYDFDAASTSDMAMIENEISELRDKADEAFAQVRSIKVQKQARRNAVSNGRH